MPLYWVFQDEVQAAGQALSDMDVMGIAGALTALSWIIIGMAEAAWYYQDPPSFGLGPSGITFYWYFWPGSGDKGGVNP